MAVFYDFCREVDDIADEPGGTDAGKRAALTRWRNGVDACYNGGDPAIAAPLCPLIERYAIPREHLLAIIDGVSMDIGHTRFETVEDLKGYCYGVASAVGLVSVRIFGCEDPGRDAYAETLGYALQFTNILRDVVEDYRTMGRVYLPQQELRAFGVDETELADPIGNPRIRRLVKLCHFRCRHFFNKARRLLPAKDRKPLTAALVMAEIYEDILNQIEARDFHLDGSRIRVSRPRKLYLLRRTMRRLKKPLESLRPPTSAAVFGAGVAGLSSALHLGLEGFTPTVYEAKSYPGGRAHSLKHAPTGLVLDNAQHVAMGCYRHFLELLNILGVEDQLERQTRLHVPYLEPGGRRSTLEAARLPAPWHLLAGLLRFSVLRHRDRLAILRLGSAIRLRRIPKPDETAGQWLQRYRQTPTAVKALWEPFCIAALNETLQQADARLLCETLRRALFDDPQGSCIIIARDGLGSLWHPHAALYLRAIGGDLRTSSQISELMPNPAGGFSFTCGRDEKATAGLVVSALPWTALRKLLPPDCSLSAKIEGLEPAPIIGVHLLCQSPILPQGMSFCGLLDSPLHWVFDRSESLPQSAHGQYLYGVIVSAATEWIDRPSADIQAMLVAELKRFFPAFEATQISHLMTYKSRDATFAARPGMEAYRPASADTPWPDCFVAGDWTDTGLPATLEGAAQSGAAVIPAMDRRYQAAASAQTRAANSSAST